MLKTLDIYLKIVLTICWKIVFSRDSVIEAVAELSELLRKNQLLVAEWSRMYNVKYVEEQEKRI